MRVSGDVGLLHRSGGDTQRALSLTPQTPCVRGGVIATDGGGGQRELRGGGEGGISTAHDSEQPVGCMVDGEGER